MTNHFNLNYRPISHWSLADTPSSRIHRIKGQDRKESAQALLESGHAEQLAAPEFDESLPDTVRESRGRIHPKLMGGEYLPNFTGEEVEIARVSVASATDDVISIRARLEHGRVHYRVVDEYETVYRCEPSHSEEPLTMGELIDLIDAVTAEGAYPDGGMGLTSVFRDMNYATAESGDPSEFVDFVTVTSEFYRELEQYYASEAQDWLKERQTEASLAEIRRQSDEFDDLIRQRRAPAIAPDQFGERRVDSLSPEELASLGRWVHTIPQISAFAIRRQPPRNLRHPLRALSKDRSFDLYWTADGIERRREFDEGQNPTVQEAFQDLVATATSARSQEPTSPVEQTVGELTQTAELAWSVGNLAQAEENYRRAVAVSSGTFGVGTGQHEEQVKLLGDFLIAEQRFQDGEALFRQMLAWAETSDDLDDQIPVLDWGALLYFRWG